MINLSNKIKETRNSATRNKGAENNRVSVRDKLLVKEVQEAEQTLPPTCQIHFEDPHKLHVFELVVTPCEGMWCGGRFRFSVDVPDDYNIVPPKVLCKTKLWHPNINEDGEICLSLLRLNSIDTLGWAPTRKLKDVVWGIDSLFTDLLNFDDPLNIEAADHYMRDKESFREKVADYIQRHARR